MTIPSVEVPEPKVMWDRMAFLWFFLQCMIIALPILIMLCGFVVGRMIGKLTDRVVALEREIQSRRAG